MEVRLFGLRRTAKAWEAANPAALVNVPSIPTGTGTTNASKANLPDSDANPHVREADDLPGKCFPSCSFNPHTREADDPPAWGTSSPSCFNPHTREADQF